jgi:hypothetical protein
MAMAATDMAATAASILKSSEIENPVATRQSRFVLHLVAKLIEQIRHCQ